MKLVLMIVLATALAATVAFAADIKLTPEEQANCEKQGGCVFASLAVIKERMQAVYDAGFKDGVTKCKEKDA